MSTDPERAKFRWRARDQGAGLCPNETGGALRNRNQKTILLDVHHGSVHIEATQDVQDEASHQPHGVPKQIQ